jgi:plastocyanin
VNSTREPLRIEGLDVNGLLTRRNFFRWRAFCTHGESGLRAAIGRPVLVCAIAVGVGALLTSAQGNTGAIKGRIVFAGALPGNAIIRMGVDPKCAALNAGKRPIQESAAVALDGSVANVFLKLEGTFPRTAVPAQPVLIDQRACFYRPRVVGVRVGQTLQVRNSDDLLHNVHSTSAAGNGFNVGQPLAGMVYSFTPKTEEMMLPIGCDLHRWMTAYVGIVSHPYFAVSGADGLFEIANVPAGTYTIKAWHERFGELKKPVTVKPGATTIDFRYEAAPAK